MNINFTKLLATTKTYPQKLTKLSLYSLVGLTFASALTAVEALKTKQVAQLSHKK